jgi:ferredoxin
MDKYEEFRIILDSNPAGAPASPVFDEILRILFSEADIDLLLKMNFSGKSSEDIAAEVSLPEREVNSRLEAMADKGLIFHRDKGDKRTYGILPTIPGLFEFPFMKGGGSSMHDRLALLWNKYKHDGQAESFAGNPTPLMRVIPVKKSLDTRNIVYSYDEVAGIINSSDYIALSECACRVSLKKCDKPTDVCLIFGYIGKFLVERGFAKKVDKQEAIHALDRAEEAGLVHSSTNTKEGAGVICNCCSCCCTILRGRLELGFKNSFADSRFTAISDDSACTGCGTCINDRCPAGAIGLSPNNTAVVDEDKCIGCGLCVSGCPASAMRMIERKDPADIPANGQELGFKVLTEKGKLAAFMTNLKK